MEIWLRPLGFTWASAGRRINKYCGSGGEKGHCSLGACVPLCSDVQKPTENLRSLRTPLLCYGDVYPDVLWYRRVWLWASDVLWCFLACDVTHCRWPGILKLAPKEDNVRIYTDPWRSLRTDYRIQNLGLLCANAEYKGWQRGDNTAGQTWEWGAGIWTATDAWPHIGLPLPLPLPAAQKDLIFAGKVLSPKLRGGRARTFLPTSYFIYVSISMYTIAFTFAKN